MSGRKVSIYLLFAFIIGNLVLIYIQYNSAKNTNTLIRENQILLTEFKASNDLKELEKDIISVESNIRGSVTMRDSGLLSSMSSQIREVEEDLGRLQKITDNDSSVIYIDQLRRLVGQKLLHSRRIIDSFQFSGKVAAENVIATQWGKVLTDSIIMITRQLEDSRERLLETVTASIDESGEKALQFGTILIVIVLSSGAVLFWFIINTIRRQNLLIDRLNTSEKKLKEAVTIKENFMANMSHEIRTPMNAVLGFTKLLKRKPLDTESKEYVDTIERSGENLLMIINDILDLSKIEAGMMRIENAPFSLRGLLYSIETLFREKVAEKKIAFEWTVEDRIPDHLEGDAIRLSQILVNLVGNALKFTDKGKINITVKGEAGTDEKIVLQFTVADSGIGIASDQLGRVFERFHQAEETLTRKFGGTGLGLSIVKDLVQLQQGNIFVESTPGKGTSFHFSIPYRISSEAALQPVSSAGKIKAPAPQQALHILIAEDNEINQTFLRHLFKEWNVSYDIASTGLEALDLLQKNNYDLVLMDIQMPGMDGYTATRHIRQELKMDIPVIAMTAHAMAGEKEKCLGNGMNEYLSKPLREEELLALLNRFSEKPVLTSRQTGPSNSSLDYQWIDLGYMKEVSQGNAGYEMEVTKQFLEAIPEDLHQLEACWKSNDLVTLKQIAHNMKTSVSVMGLTDQLRPFLDNLEYLDLTPASFQENFHQLSEICNHSLTEARNFLESLAKRM